MDETIFQIFRGPLRIQSFQKNEEVNININDMITKRRRCKLEFASVSYDEIDKNRPVCTKKTF